MRTPLRTPVDRADPKFMRVPWEYMSRILGVGSETHHLGLANGMVTYTLDEDRLGLWFLLSSHHAIHAISASALLVLPIIDMIVDGVFVVSFHTRNNSRLAKRIVSLWHL